jgi:hypothetical protein
MEGPQSPVAKQTERPRAPLGAIVIAAAVAAVGLARFFGYTRAIIAILMFLVLFSFGFRQLRAIANSPPEPELTDVSDYGLKYVCTMCGLELRVEVAARDRAPTHCMESMKLVRTGGTPPLTTVE